MTCTRAIAFAAIVACAAVGSAGWVFMRTPAPAMPPGGWQTVFAGGRTSASVWREGGTAASAAAARGEVPFSRMDFRSGMHADVQAYASGARLRGHPRRRPSGRSRRDGTSQARRFMIQ